MPNREEVAKKLRNCGARAMRDAALACGMDVVDLTDYKLTYCLCDAAYVALLRLL